MTRELSRRRALLSTLTLLPAARLMRGQQPAQTPQFSSSVKVVNVFATVRDKQGQIVKNLTKDDFTLEEDGRPQTIRYFAQASDLPLTLGLLVDTSGSERRMIGAERQASYKFLEQVLRPDRDKAFLLHFDHDVELLQDLTSSRERLEKALDLLNKPEWGENGNSDPGQSGGEGGRGDHDGHGHHGHGGREHGGGTAFYDAIYLASDDLMGKQTGRKAVILLTDGEDSASKISLEEAIRTTQRSDTQAYAIRVADQESSHGFGGREGMGGGRHGGWGGMPGGGRPGGGRSDPGEHREEHRTDGKKVLEQISQETGGAYFELSKKKPLDEIFSAIQEDLRNQYSLGYSSDKSDTGPGYRRIQLAAKQKGLIVRARDGYYAGAKTAQS